MANMFHRTQCWARATAGIHPHTVGVSWYLVSHGRHPGSPPIQGQGCYKIEVRTTSTQRSKH